MEFLFFMCPVNSNLKLRQVAMNFFFLFQWLISLIWLKIFSLKPFFVLEKSLIFHGIFLPKVLLVAVFKNSGICEYYSMLKTKKKLNGPFLLKKTRKTEIMEFLFLKCSWKFMDTISHNETSLLKYFTCIKKIMHFFMMKNVNFVLFLWALLWHSKKITGIKIIVTTILTNLVTNSHFFLFCSFIETKNKNQVFSKLLVW